MSQKDYEMVARALRDAKGDVADHMGALDYAATRLANAFEEDNRRFDRARFLKAAGADDMAEE